MKRSPLKRGKGLKRGKPLARGNTRLRAKRLVKRQHARPVVDDGFGEAYLEFVAAHPCCMASLGGCLGDVVGHHHRLGEHARVHKKAVPLCYAHHIPGWHDHGRVAPLTRDETVAVFEAEIDRLNQDWEKAA